MWLNKEKIVESAIASYRQSLSSQCPNHVIIDGLFNDDSLCEVMNVLQGEQGTDNWETQKHSYSALYVDAAEWEATSKDQRFVKRDRWQRKNQVNKAQEFLAYLRSAEFLTVLSAIFNVQLTDENVAETLVNTNYFRLNTTDFVEQHADDSPGREVCMLLYLNNGWDESLGGELVFSGEEHQEPISIAPLFNRCVLFNPSSKGSEHWVEKMKVSAVGGVDGVGHVRHGVNDMSQYRYNVTSWYWSL